MIGKLFRNSNERKHFITFMLFSCGCIFLLIMEIIDKNLNVENILMMLSSAVYFFIVAFFPYMYSNTNKNLIPSCVKWILGVCNIVFFVSLIYKIFI